MSILDACQLFGAVLFCLDDSGYPAALKFTVPDRPALLCVRGPLFPAPALAVIGAREPTSRPSTAGKRGVV